MQMLLTERCLTRAVTCAKSCDCKQVDCSSYCNYPSTLLSQNVNEGTCKQRGVSAFRKKKLEEDALHQYHKQLVLELLNTRANGEVKTLTNLQFMLGFSEHQISQVLENVASVEVWDIIVMPRKFCQFLALCLRTYHVMKTGIGMVPIMITTRSLMMSSWMNGMKSFKTTNCSI